MPPNVNIDQALILKKRARRRLVGAVALVILMMIILPNVLVDRSAQSPREPITILMPENDNKNVANEPKIQDKPTAIEVIKTENLPEKLPDQSSTDAVNQSAPQVVETPLTEVVETPLEKAKLPEDKPKSIANTQVTIVKSDEKKSVESTNVNTATKHYLVQVGVYSDPNNVKQLQSKITQAGLTSHTDFIKTDKGQKIRLRVGSFPSRDAAAESLKKLEAVGLSGMVMIDG